jgi:hypothetical protein
MDETKKENKKPLIKIFDLKEDIAEKFDFYIKIVLGVFIVAFITMLIIVGTLIIDSFHFNSVTYKEYSTKLETQSSLLESNEFLLEMNKQNQELISKNQKQIEKLIIKIDNK